YKIKQSIDGLRYLQNVLREACGGQAVRLGAKPLARSFTLAQGWGEAPKRSVARSTPTLPTRAQRDVGKVTPKK
ncbi:MAG: hypothetical protein NZ455_12130, partial [Bacteroidia bacterium]|nr:hypothetical protein [Bacteroidia bacterium]